ncbi:hypothetical protein [Rhizobium sp. PEPV16]|uniref:hypothetical protein n=1 Tax=Rhizobium sp. PEPV16 TaxID=1820614 RepID=UPI00124CA7AE|nr:hypothetical protein [Rhizobium sp. PEPV16]KAF5887219.1 hypothetical protein FY112_04085 [Rhizobium sp. PEPV16]
MPSDDAIISGNHANAIVDLLSIGSIGVMVGSDDFAEMRIKHLEMVQGVVSRLSNHSTNFKNYCVTLVTAIIGFALTANNVNIIPAAVLPVVAFAYLDARYLRLERAFRSLYNHVRLEDWNSQPTFDLDLKSTQFDRHPLIRAVFTWTILGFYGSLLFGVAVIFWLKSGKP